MSKAPISNLVLFSLVLLGVAVGSGGCSSNESTDPSGHGGSPAAGGSSSSGNGGVAGSTLPTGGAGGGAAGSGGSPAAGGSSAGGSSVAGSGAGGSSAGGSGANAAGSGGHSGKGGASATGGQTGTAGKGGATSTGGSAGSSVGGSAGGSVGGGAGGSVTPGGCIICDDFESSTTTLDAAKWVIDTSMGAAQGKAEVVAGGAHDSGKAVKVSGGYIKVDAKAGLFSTVPAHFFMRMNMKFDKAQPSDHVTYLMLADKTKNGQLRFGAQNGGMIWNYDTTDSILPDYNAAATSLKPAANTWHCFEFEIDGTAPLMRVWMDGTEAPQLLLDTTPTSGIDDRWMRDMSGWKPNITNFGFGNGYPVNSLTTWLDDIAISATRVGCQF